MKSEQLITTELNECCSTITAQLIRRTCITAALLPFMVCFSVRVMAQDGGGDTTFVSNGNPVIRHKYTADPAALVYNNRVYLYTGHDVAPAKENRYVMHDWLCFSSADMKTWIEHPSPLTSNSRANGILFITTAPWCLMPAAFTGLYASTTCTTTKTDQ